MSYIQYHVKSKRNIKWHATERGAKISVAASNRNAKSVEYAIMEETEFNEKYNDFITVKSLMYGVPVIIRAQDKNTCNDPSTERYWSM